MSSKIGKKIDNMTTHHCYEQEITKIISVMRVPEINLTIEYIYIIYN